MLVLKQAIKKSITAETRQLTDYHVYSPLFTFVGNTRLDIILLHTLKE